jgi:hypothetical protein
MGTLSIRLPSFPLPCPTQSLQLRPWERRWPLRRARPLSAPWVTLLPPACKRPARPKIDIEAKITDSSKDIVAAQKLLKETKTLQRSERRKKQCLIKKAAGLCSTDVERIAVTKRCVLWEPGHCPTSVDMRQRPFLTSLSWLDWVQQSKRLLCECLWPSVKVSPKVFVFGEKNRSGF